MSRVGVAIAVGAGAAVVLFLYGRKRHFYKRHFYEIGTPGVPWGASERAAWLKHVGAAKRSYMKEVVDKLEPLKQTFDVVKYGELSQNPSRYPLFCVKTKNWDERKPCMLLTGGVHGYETSGVQGALLFLQENAQHYSKYFNIAVCPCICPWGYETIQRWTAVAEDPNRHWLAEDSLEENAALMAYLATFPVTKWAMHLDLHETTDTDVLEFDPARMSRDGKPHELLDIPDGFYLIGCLEDKENANVLKWLGASVGGVEKITHIAPPDDNNEIVEETVVQHGVILTPHEGRSRCMTNAVFRATTEVYPDSKVVTPEQCNRAQAAAATAGLDYILATYGDDKYGIDNIWVAKAFTS